VWYDCALRLGLTGPLADLWSGTISTPDATMVDDTIQLLIGLPAADTVPRLVALVEADMDKDDGQLLRAASLVRRRALAALVQIVDPEAEAYLGQALPEKAYCFVPAARPEPGGDGRWRSAFWIARSRVTMDDWADFVRAGGYKDGRFWHGLERDGQGGSVLTGWPMASGSGKDPVREITWAEALAYARWRAESTEQPVDLVHEIEWDRAAASNEEIAQGAGREHRHPRRSNGSSDPAGCRICLRVVPWGEATSSPASD
jgi:hypothetical protein